MMVINNWSLNFEQTFRQGFIILIIIVNVCHNSLVIRHLGSMYDQQVLNSFISYCVTSIQIRTSITVLWCTLKPDFNRMYQIFSKSITFLEVDVIKTDLLVQRSTKDVSVLIIQQMCKFCSRVEIFSLENTINCTVGYY